MIKTFTEYITIYETVTTSIMNWKKTRPRFAKVLVAAQKQATTDKKQSLTSLLITPVQRIARYPLLLRELLKCMDRESDPTEYETLEIALELTTKVTDSINNSVHDYEQRRRVSEIFTQTRNIQKHVPFIPSRRILLVEDLSLSIVKQRNWRTSRFVERPRRVYLFNDMILFTKKNKYKAHCFLERGQKVRVTAIEDTNSFSLEIGKLYYELIAPSVEIRDKWVEKLECTQIHTGTLLDLSFPDLDSYQGTDCTVAVE
jgi:hypothetical protein